MLGARFESSEAYRAGAAYVVFGPYDGESNVADIGVRYTGESEEDFAGGAVASAGDIDGDGEIDILIGAYQENTSGTAAGAAYLVLGPHEAGGSLRRALKSRVSMQKIGLDIRLQAWEIPTVMVWMTLPWEPTVRTVGSTTRGLCTCFQKNFLRT